MAVEEEQDGLERLSRDFLDVLLCDLGKGEGGAPLEVDVVAVREGRERAERVAREEVGRRAVWVGERRNGCAWRESEKARPESNVE